VDQRLRVLQGAFLVTKVGDNPPVKPPVFIVPAPQQLYDFGRIAHDLKYATFVGTDTLPVGGKAIACDVVEA
jgi:hypothetical protein